MSLIVQYSPKIVIYSDDHPHQQNLQQSITSRLVPANGNGHYIFVDPTHASREPQVQWAIQPGQFYTLAFIDIDAPYPDHPTSAPFLHWLQMNVSTKNPRGDVIVPYMPPQPPADSPPHQYDFVLFQQPQYLDRKQYGLQPPSQRGNFDVTQFQKQYGLQWIDTAAMVSGFIQHPQKKQSSHNNRNNVVVENDPDGLSVVAPPKATSTTRVRATKQQQQRQQKIPGGKLAYMLPGAPITDADARTCRCTLHVGAKQPEWCLEEHAYFQKRKNPSTGRIESCYNPYAVCVSSTQHAYPGVCTEYFNFDEIPDDELRAYAHLHAGIKVPKPWTREAQMQEIRKYVCAKSTEHPLCHPSSQ